MNKQGLDRQQFLKIIEVWVCSTRNIQKMDLNKLRQNLVNTPILAKYFFLKADDFWKKNPQTSHSVAQ